MTLQFNEGKACDAVLRVIERREGQQRHGVRFPEKEGHAAPIELICNIGSRLFALEHTGVEPFSGHIRMEAEADRLFRPIEALVAGKLPAHDTFELSIPVNALRGVRKKRLAEMHSALATWIVTQAPNLPVAKYAQYLPSVRKVAPPGLPFPVRLDRFQSIVPPGRFMIKHSIDQTDLASSREARIKIACDKKLPKLGEWQLNADARTVLILEVNDIQLTNPELVFETLAALRGNVSGWADEIYLVSTIVPNAWYVHALWIDDRDYYNLCEDNLCLSEFNPGSLIKLTGR